MTLPIQVIYTYEVRDAKGENVAHCRVKTTPGGLWITDVWCDAEHRRKGYARAGAGNILRKVWLPSNRRARRHGAPGRQ